MTLEVRPATPERWDDVVAVMGTRGDPSRCWCQYFRLRGSQWSKADTAAKRAALQAQVVTGPPPGVLGYDGGTPSGWCAVAPKSSYARVAASRNWRHDADDEGTWAITCFVVPPGRRRQGIAGELLGGAVEFAGAHGATAVEGCAVDLEEAARVSSADLYRGPLSTFLAAGFDVVRRNSPAFVLVRRRL
ncbi:MAG TPA: GNAT family N-acetyltransferase [Kribbella sp.]|nr:GNAT family N-acetyltransferase [Kribbella sp.]